MNRRSYVVLAGSLLTAGCTSSTGEKVSSQATPEPPVNVSVQTATKKSPKTVSIGAESDLPDGRLVPRKVQFYPSEQQKSVTVTRHGNQGFERQYDVSADVFFLVEIYDPANYTVAVSVSGKQSESIEITKDTFLCTPITNVRTNGSKPIRVVEPPPNLCDSTGNETTTTNGATTQSQ